MRYVAAYLLAVHGGNANPTAKDLEKIIGSVGIETESDKVSKVISELKGKNLEELIKAGSEKLASVPAGGTAAASGAAPAAGGDAKAEEKKEEKKKEESEEESDDDMGFGLFD